MVGGGGVIVIIVQITLIIHLLTYNIVKKGGGLNHLPIVSATLYQHIVVV